MKQVIASFFLLIFSFQVLPIKEIGKILYKNQITEEEVHRSNDAAKDIKEKKGCDLTYYPHHSCDNISRIFFHTNLLRTVITRAEHLPEDYIPEITTPPPNC